MSTNGVLMTADVVLMSTNGVLMTADVVLMSSQFFNDFSSACNALWQHTHFATHNMNYLI